MPTNDIKLIVFDLFGVLLEEGHLVSNGLLRQLPAGYDPASVKQHYQALNLGRIDEVEFWRSLGIDEPAVLRQRFLDEFKLDPDYEETVGALSADFQLAILSNLPAVWADYLVARHSFDACFAPRIFSGHVAAKKPQQEIYRKLFDQVGVSPAQSLFIDDRLENLQAAHRIGLKTVLLMREATQHSFQPDYRIEQLGELVDLVRL